MLQLSLRGTIDRIDQSTHGDLRVVDYKTRSRPYATKEIADGLSTQAVLYALIVGQMDWGLVKESGYRMLLRTKDGKLQNKLDWSQDNLPKEAREVLETLSSHQEDMRLGRFPAAPPSLSSDFRKCADWCQLAAFCQASPESRHKAKEGFLT